MHYANIAIRPADDVDLPADGSVLERLPHVRCTRGETHADGRDETLPFLDNWNDTNALQVLPGTTSLPSVPLFTSLEHFLHKRAAIHRYSMPFTWTSYIHPDPAIISQSHFPPPMSMLSAPLRLNNILFLLHFRPFLSTILQRLGWGENFRPRVRMQPLTVFPHCTDLPPPVVSSRMNTLTHRTRNYHQSVCLYRSTVIFRTYCHPARPLLKLMTLTIPFRFVPCQLSPAERTVPSFHSHV
jgi:hypothetical protein